MTIPELARKAAESYTPFSQNHDPSFVRDSRTSFEVGYIRGAHDIAAQKDALLEVYRKNLSEAQADRDRALSQLEDARKDSERLEWMAQRGAWLVGTGSLSNLRAAIDEARNQQP